MFITLKSLVLASNSPRRKEYFHDLGLEFTTHSADIDERAGIDEDPDTFVLRMAGEKALAVRHLFPSSWVVAADTIVCLDRTILGKPRDADDAVAMLLALSGREHTVMTGFCVTCEEQDVHVLRSVASLVRFADFSEDVARAYAETGEPLDKAGAYGIQGKGAFLVTQVVGSYSNIVGMPLHEVVEELVRWQVIKPSRTSG
jgi:septum formation protein